MVKFREARGTGSLAFFEQAERFLDHFASGTITARLHCVTNKGFYFGRNGDIHVSAPACFQSTVNRTAPYSLTLFAPLPLKVHAIDFCAQDKIALAQAADFMREDDDVYLSPGERQVRMVPLLLSQLAHLVDKRERLPEVRKEESFCDVMFLDHLPIGHLIREHTQFRAAQGRHSAATGHALPVSQTTYTRSTHTSPSLNSTGYLRSGRTCDCRRGMSSG